MTNYVDWSPEVKDPFLKDKEVDLHTKLHNKRSAQKSTKEMLLGGKRKWRSAIIDKALLVCGKKFSGEVLDIGSGDGWCAAYIADKYKDSVKCVYALECNVPAVSKLIPNTFAAFNVPSDRYKAVLGTFNWLPEKDKFDFITSMGAIHHSENLHRTLGQCYKALVPGGWMIASEPALPNNTTNAQYHKKYNSVRNFQHIEKVRDGDRSDHFYRLCEYEVAAHHAGFDVYPFVFDPTIGKPLGDAALKKRVCYVGFDKIILRPLVGGKDFDRLLLILQKPERPLPKIPHAR